MDFKPKCLNLMAFTTRVQCKNASANANGVNACLLFTYEKWESSPLGNLNAIHDNEVTYNGGIKMQQGKKELDYLPNMAHPRSYPSSCIGIGKLLLR